MSKKLLLSSIFIISTLAMACTPQTTSTPDNVWTTALEDTFKKSCEDGFKKEAPASVTITPAQITSICSCSLDTLKKQYTDPNKLDAAAGAKAGETCTKSVLGL
ncbi:MAG: hypothetical protein U0457_17255 [Candidatus Sericytochromatia bacterium]